MEAILRFLGFAQADECLLPASLQLGGYQAIVGIDGLVAPTCGMRLILRSLELLLPVALHLSVFLALLSQERFERIQLGRLNGLKEGSHDDGLNGRTIQRRTHPLRELFSQTVTDVAGTGLVDGPHHVAALAAGGQSLE
jgi:hypothetical protein